MDNRFDLILLIEIWQQPGEYLALKDIFISLVPQIMVVFYIVLPIKSTLWL